MRRGERQRRYFDAIYLEQYIAGGETHFKMPDKQAFTRVTGSIFSKQCTPQRVTDLINGQKDGSSRLYFLCTYSLPFCPYVCYKADGGSEGGRGKNWILDKVSSV